MLDVLRLERDRAGRDDDALAFVHGFADSRDKQRVGFTEACGTFGNDVLSFLSRENHLGQLFLAWSLSEAGFDLRNQPAFLEKIVRGEHVHRKCSTDAGTTPPLKLRGFLRHRQVPPGIAIPDVAYGLNTDSEFARERRYTVAHVLQRDAYSLYFGGS